MKFKPEKKYIQIGFTIFFTAIAIIAVYFLFFRIDAIKSGISTVNRILSPIFYGLVLAYLMTPLLNLIENKWYKPLFEKYEWLKDNKSKNKNIRLISVFTTIIIVLFFLYLFFASVIPQLYSSVQNLVSQYNTYTKNLTVLINNSLANNPEIAKLVSSLIKDYSTEADDFLNGIALPTIRSFLVPNVNDIVSTLSTGLMKVVTFVWNVIIGLVISLYVLISKERFAQGSVRLCYAFLERNTANKFIESVRFTHHTFIGFFGGKVVDSLIIGLITYFCCLCFKMPYTVLVSVIIGVTNIIPFFGPYLGAIPTTLIILLVDPKKALTFLILILIIQQLDGNFIGPMILSQSTGLTSFWIIFSITLFGGLFGVLGMVIGVPITAVIAAFIEKAAKSRLSRKELPLEPESYINVEKITSENEFIPYNYVKPERKKIDKNSPSYKLLIAIGKFLKKIGLLLVQLVKLLFAKIKALIIKIKSKNQ